MKRPTVLLFDIDGTLLSASGAGKRAVERAIAAVTNQTYRFDFRLDGMTDRAIVRRALTSLRQTDSDLEPTIAAILDSYVDRLAEELAQVRDCHVYPGVREMLDAAQAKGPSIALGLGTGNIHRGATLKLGSARLDAYFAFGGFGSDHEERPAIVRTGAERGAAHLGCDLGACRVVVIGDTPRDIAAAQTIGAESVGVATGHFNCDDLRAAGATHVFADLAATGAREAVFGPG